MVCVDWAASENRRGINKKYHVNYDNNDSAVHADPDVPKQILSFTYKTNTVWWSW